MTRRVSRILRRLLVATSALVGLVARADTITAVGDHWCPYNCAPDSSAQAGYMVDLLRRALAPEHKLEYKLEPWSRAVELVSAGQRNILIGTTPSTTPGLRLTAAWGVDRSCFYTTQNSSWTYAALSDLAGKRIGVVQDYNYDANGPFDRMLERYRTRKDQLLETAYGADATQANFRKLAAARMDLAIENENVANYTLRELKLDGAVRQAGCLTHYLGTVHLGLSRKWPQGAAIAKRLEERLAAMRASGELEQVLKQYGLRDWQAALPAKPQ